MPIIRSLGARQTAVAAFGFRMNAGVEVFSVVVGLLLTNRPFALSRGRFVTNKLTTAENTFHLHIHTETRGCNDSLTGS